LKRKWARGKQEEFNSIETQLIKVFFFGKWLGRPLGFYPLPPLDFFWKGGEGGQKARMAGGLS